MQIYCNTHSAWENNDTCCGSIMLMLKLAKDNNVYEAAASKNGTTPADDDIHGSIILK